MNKFLLVFGCLFIISVVGAEPLREPGQGESPALKPRSLVLPDMSGQNRNLDDWQGKVIILNFWATWCRPCQIEIPDLMRYQSAYAEHNLQVIGVGVDEPEKLKNYIRTVGINYPVLYANPEDQFNLLKQWGNSFGVLPYTVVIDKEGRLVYMQTGLFREAAFLKFVKPYLN